MSGRGVIGILQVLIVFGEWLEDFLKMLEDSLSDQHLKGDKMVERARDIKERVYLKILKNPFKKVGSKFLEEPRIHDPRNVYIKSKNIL